MKKKAKPGSNLSAYASAKLLKKNRAKKAADLKAAGSYKKKK